MSRIPVTLLALACCGAALADTVTVTSYTSRSAVDGGIGDPPDGRFDWLQEGDAVVVANNAGGDPAEIRGLYEFVLPPEIMQAGTSINQVIVTVPVIAQSAGVRNLEVHGYQRNFSDEVTPAHFETEGGVSFLQTGGWPTTTNEFYVSYFLQIFPGSTGERVGFVLRSNDPDTFVQFGPGASMLIDYTPPQGNAPTLTLHSPDDGTTYFEGESIDFSASSWDAEDAGSRDWAIEWQSSLSGYFGWGPQVNASLPAGTHLVQATLHDSDQNTVSRARTITVLPLSNTPPSVSITSPEDGALLWLRDPPTRFTATASDPEQGSMDAVIEWWLDDHYRLGTGPELATVLPAGSHTITVRVTDTAGATAEQRISVTVENPPAYCPARGNSTTREYIREVTVNGVTSLTSSNNGYALLPSPLFRAQAGVPGTIRLVPRFVSTPSVVAWGVWADLNQDGTFTPDEMLASGSGTGTISRTFTLPTTVRDGHMRLRVVMRQGGTAMACGNFSRGEVEDYTLEITGGQSEPPAASYCSARGLESADKWISEARIGTVRSQTGDDGGYRDGTVPQVFTVLRNGTNAAEFRAGGPLGGAPAGWAVWVDFNHDRQFASSERVLIGTAGSLFRGPILVPPQALDGQTRMRVATLLQDSPVSACQTFFAGEVEDYTIDIVP